MSEEFKPRYFRLLKPGLFSLDRKKLYLATETPLGYTLKINDFEWIGFPKKTVERSGKLFREYSRTEHREYNKRRRIPIRIK